jgi:hypothetical protein
VFSQPDSLRAALLVPSGDLKWLALTTDQAQILYELVRENRDDITRRWSHGIWDGLSEALRNIERGGGAYTRLPPSFGIP